MNLILCVDEAFGLHFCGKRQSSDKALTARILQLAGEAPLWMSTYSAPLFEGHNVRVDDAFLQKAALGDYCFLENSELPQDLTTAESVILCKWNRLYPSTQRLDLKLLSTFTLTDLWEFPGNSHETITMERYSR